MKLSVVSISTPLQDGLVDDVSVENVQQQGHVKDLKCRISNISYIRLVPSFDTPSFLGKHGKQSWLPRRA